LWRWGRGIKLCSGSTIKNIEKFGDVLLTNISPFNHHFICKKIDLPAKQNMFSNPEFYLINNGFISLRIYK